MGMTKAERAKMEALETELALRWPTAEEPRLMTRDEIEIAKVEVQSLGRKTARVALGWFFSCWSGCTSISQGWSDGVYHSHHNVTGDSSARGMGQMYRTEADALLAARWAMCRDHAKALRSIDLRMIEVRADGVGVSVSLEGK